MAVCVGQGVGLVIFVSVLCSVQGLVRLVKGITKLWMRISLTCKRYTTYSPFSARSSFLDCLISTGVSSVS